MPLKEFFNWIIYFNLCQNFVSSFWDSSRTYNPRFPWMLGYRFQQTCLPLLLYLNVMYTYFLLQPLFGFLLIYFSMYCNFYTFLFFDSCGCVPTCFYLVFFSVFFFYHSYLLPFFLNNLNIINNMQVYWSVSAANSSWEEPGTRLDCRLKKHNCIYKEE